MAIAGRVRKRCAARIVLEIPRTKRSHCHGSLHPLHTNYPRGSLTAWPVTIRMSTPRTGVEKIRLPSRNRWSLKVIIFQLAIKKCIRGITNVIIFAWRDGHAAMFYDRGVFLFEAQRKKIGIRRNGETTIAFSYFSRKIELNLAWSLHKQHLIKE